MKKIYLSLLSFALCNLAISQANLVQSIPENAPTSTQVRAPNGLVSHTTLRAHFIIPASELTSVPNGTSFNSFGFEYLDGVVGGANGNIQIYLENTADVTNLKSNNWATAISSMTSIYNGALTLPVGTTASNVDLATTTTFTYSGGGIYVAYDYLGTTFSTDAASYMANADIPAATKMDATGAGITTPPATLTQTSAFRPQVRFGFPNPFTNEISVESLILDKGHPNPLIETTQVVSAEIKNSSAGDINNIDVTLTITGANPITVTNTIPTLIAGNSVVVNFPGLSLANLGSHIVSVSIPADEVNANNQLSKEQIISCDTMAYATNEAPYTNIGYNTGTGILAIKQTTNPSISTRVKGVTVYISDGVGNAVKGLLLNSTGQIIDSSASVTITAGQIDTEVYFNFLGNVILPPNSTFYVGLRQSANATTGYFPVGTQEPATVPAGRVYGFGANGGAATEYNTLGMLLIKAVVQARFQSGHTPANGQVCQGNPVTLLASSGFSNYEFFVEGNSVQSSASSSYMTTPTSTIHFYVVGSIGACSYTSAPLDSVQVKTNIEHSLSDAFCQGDTYMFGSMSLNSPGVYKDTLPSSGGCDSIVTLTLSENIVDFSATSNGMVLTATQSGAMYQWINCTSGIAVPGAMQQTYTATTAGNYAVIVTMNNCSDTSQCILVDDAGLGEVDLYGLQIYPNPADNLVTISMDKAQIEALTISDLNGKTINSWNVNASSKTINVEVLVPGVYLIHIQTINGNITKRFVKN